MKTKITNKNLLDYGFKNVSSENPIHPYEKILIESTAEESNEGYGDGDDNSVALVISMETNSPNFGIRTQDGCVLLSCNLEQLKVIEDAIIGYSSNF